MARKNVGGSRRPNGFPREIRIVRSREFDRVFAGRKSAADAKLVVYAAPNGLAFTRLGIIAGKRLGNAVVRNRAKRLAREVFRTSREQIPAGYDLVVIPRNGARAADFAGIRSSLLSLARRAAALWQDS
jgi:ribonuclease P protein component